jgi:hypothetical protein
VILRFEVDEGGHLMAMRKSAKGTGMGSQVRGGAGPQMRRCKPHGRGGIQMN